MQTHSNFPSKTSYLLLAFLLSSISILKAQSYGSSNNDAAYQIIHTADSGYMVCGDYGMGNKDIYLIKLSSCGEALWSKTFGDSLINEHANSIAQTQDGGYVVMGTYDNDFANGTPRAWLLRLNSAGDTLWTRKYTRGSYADWGVSVYVKPNGNFVLGMSTDDIVMTNPFTVFETDSAGNEIWNNVVNGSSSFSGYATQVFEGSDNSTLTATSWTVGPFTLMVTKVDSAGNTVFSRMYENASGSFNPLIGFGICETNDNSYIVVGSRDYTVNGTGRDFYYMKINSSGDTLWSRTFGGAGTDELIGVRALPDGSFIAAGNTNTLAGNSDILLVRFDQQGDTLWTRTYGGAFSERMAYLELTSDGGYVMVGDTAYGTGNSQLWIVFTDSLGNVLQPCSTPTTIEGHFYDIQFAVYPNPVSDKLKIDYFVPAICDVRLEIFDAFGRCVYRSENRNEPGNYSAVIDRRNLLSTGIYSVRLSVETMIRSKKFIVLDR